jgi:dCMP deaminase
VLYCTHEPCSFCTKAIINAGIRRIVFVYPYPDALASEMRSQASLEVCQLSEKMFQEMDLALKAFLQQRG